MEIHKRGLPVNYVKNTSTVKLQMCFFIVKDMIKILFKSSAVGSGFTQ